MHHNMVFSCNYGKQKKGRQKTKCSSVVGHFDGHGGAPEQCRQHCLMQHVQGYPGSRWMPQLGYYLLLSAPATARAKANKTKTKKWTNFAGHFDGLGSVPVQYCMHCSKEEVQGFGKSHWMPPSGEYCR